MSTIKVDAIQTSTGVSQYTVSAWVTFKGTATVSIYGSGNVSSITDAGVGSYRANWSPTLPSTNYCPLATSGNEGLVSRSNFRVSIYWSLVNVDGNYAARDSDNISVSATY